MSRLREEQKPMPMMDSDPFTTQRDAGPTVVTDLRAAGFDDAEEIGRGGFGIVYRCTQVALDRTVAVKALTAEPNENRERFLREQRAMGRLTGHPNIVGVLQVGETRGGYPYLVMQYHQRGSLDTRIRRSGPVPLDEAMRLGVKMAGALESAHRLGILHRDVKPANILMTDYGEPALSDFGIAHISGGFKTAAGTFTGSPAFTAPEILSGDPPTQASDVYGLGATLFCALTGHAAFERRSGEGVFAQFLRIATECAPDLRQTGIPADVAAAVEAAMARDPRDRPSAAALGEQIKQIQAVQGFAVDDMALLGEPDDEPQQRPAAADLRRSAGNLPVELTSFIGRRTEVSDVTKLLSSSRLVTLTGIGGVGKTRLALRVAAGAAPEFPHGVWLAELGELTDGSLLTDVVAGAIGVRDESARLLGEVLVEHLSSRRLLLVLDNCEQVVNEAAKLTETLLRACPELRILATSREALGIGGESVHLLAPLAIPDPDREPTLRGLPGYDAVALFAERAAAAVPGYRITDDDKAVVARICSRLDGLPLAIELAAARLRAMSTEQILERLDDRYALLTRGSRGAPPRQQTLAWSVDWSYDLCTPAEQRLWGRLSVFAAGFDLEAAEYVCGPRFPADKLLDLLSSLVDKSILIRTETDGAVRFRLLETFRSYGRSKVEDTDEYGQLRARHYEWYRRLVGNSESEWFSPRQMYWIERLDRELPNLREALEFGVSMRAPTRLDIPTALHPFFLAHGLISEGRRWLDRALNGSPVPEKPSPERAKALYAAIMLAALQADLPAAERWVTDGKAVVEHLTDPTAHALISIGEAFTSLMRGEVAHARDCLDHAVTTGGELAVRAGGVLMLGWAYEMLGANAEAMSWYERVLAFADARGEWVFKTNALWSIGLAEWSHGDPAAAERRFKEGLQLAHRIHDLRMSALFLEALSWVVRANGEPRVAVMLASAAAEWSRAVGSPLVGFHDFSAHHQECARRAREALGDWDFDAARREGASLTADEAVAYALGE